MKNNKIYLRILVAVMSLIIAYAMYGLVIQKQKEKSYECSVVLDNSGSDRWVSFKRGLEQAAKEYNVKINIVSTGKLRGTAEEVRLISKEIKNGANGLIVQINEDNEFWSIAEETIKKAYIVFTETDLLPEGTVAAVTPDWNEIGKALAEDINEKETEKTEHTEKVIQIGILSENGSLLSTRQAISAIEDKLKKTSFEIKWIVEECNGEQLTKQLKEESVDVLVSLENDLTETAVDVLMETGNESSLYGVGCSEKLVYYLDHGEIQTLVIPNDFLMGYQSVKNLVNQLENHSSMIRQDMIDFYVVDRENLYDEKLQRILFPVVQ